MVGAIEAQIVFTLQSRYLLFFGSLEDILCFLLGIALSSVGNDTKLWAFE